MVLVEGEDVVLHALAELLLRGHPGGGNGLVGMISGMVWLFKDKKRSMDTVLIISGVLAALATA